MLAASKAAHQQKGSYNQQQQTDLGMRHIRQVATAKPTY
jgi:hypothetical protein